MNETINPAEYDAAFGNLLNNMMISMEKDYVEQQVNFELQELADAIREEIIDAQYEDLYIERMCAEHDAMTYACHSYDE